MKSKEDAQAAIAQAVAQSRQALLVFAGAPGTCVWCEKLKAYLADKRLDAYCQEHDIDLRWIILGAKGDEIIAAENEKSTTTREDHQIKSIPTAILFDEKGRRVAATEFIDTVETLGADAYIDWIEELALI